MKLFLQQTAGSAPKGYAGHANGSIAEGGGEEQLPCIRVRQNISRIDGEGVQQNLYICDLQQEACNKTGCSSCLGCVSLLEQNMPCQIEQIKDADITQVMGSFWQDLR